MMRYICVTKGKVNERISAPAHSARRRGKYEVRYIHTYTRVDLWGGKVRSLSYTNNWRHEQVTIAMQRRVRQAALVTEFLQVLSSGRIKAASGIYGKGRQR